MTRRRLTFALILLAALIALGAWLTATVRRNRERDDFARAIATGNEAEVRDIIRRHPGISRDELKCQLDVALPSWPFRWLPQYWAYRPRPHTPVELAVNVRASRTIVRVLLDDGATTEGLNVHPYTPLLMAIATQQPENAVELIRHGARVDAMGPDGAPALIMALQEREWEIVRALVIAGADVTAKDKDGRTAPDLARAAGQTEIVNLLEERMRTPTTITEGTRP